MTDELTELRAALIQMAKTLETQRACVLRIVSLIDKSMSKSEPVPSIVLERITQ